MMGDMENHKKSNGIQELRATVQGRVQGVGFRYFVVEKAARLGLRGYARNTIEGHVEVVAQGERLALESLLAHLRSGPSAARVEDVEVHWGEPATSLNGFHVRW
jgi:acylphosphatase